MKKIILLFIVATLLSCETKTIEVPVKGGEIAVGPNAGSKFYIVSDDNVELTKTLINAYSNMDVDGMYEVLPDTVMWFAPKLKDPIPADRKFMEEYFSQYDSISQVVQGYIPHQWEGQENTVVSVASREIKYKKDGTIEDERLFERFFIKNNKIFRVMAWSAEWNTD
jgi:hypothetical protein